MNITNGVLIVVGRVALVTKTTEHAMNGVKHHAEEESASIVEAKWSSGDDNIIVGRKQHDKTMEKAQDEDEDGSRIITGNMLREEARGQGVDEGTDMSKEGSPEWEVRVMEKNIRPKDVEGTIDGHNVKEGNGDNMRTTQKVDVEVEHAYEREVNEETWEVGKLGTREFVGPSTKLKTNIGHKHARDRNGKTVIDAKSFEEEGGPLKRMKGDDNVRMKCMPGTMLSTEVETIDPPCW
ncbi:uncharacterized protein A4U43_C10F7810 [Asparagus officinalis]|uniref:Uncharacterized protein n=1 Tax=Asparagus officinalis TaxID=4686 RepID=A0A5P1E4K9_ASPOF|nr:uncharacterized protein A4U43_C10F7810 [Asparagus officinalis]